jgi:hypothetical protein
MRGQLFAERLALARVGKRGVECRTRDAYRP